MPNYDVILIHPPAIYDFRRKALFPGALAATAAQAQFTKIPIGMLSIADYLDRHGYKVTVDNLGDRMVSDASFDVEAHLKNMTSRIFAIGLHFQQHSPGAIEIARLCKKLHPHSLVVLGGLTATRFHEEIIQKYEFVDAVVRGEAEKPFLELVRAYENKGKITGTPSLTYRGEPPHSNSLPQGGRGLSAKLVPSPSTGEGQGEGEPILPPLSGSLPQGERGLGGMDSPAQGKRGLGGMDSPAQGGRGSGDIVVTPLMPPSQNLDEFEYTRLDLLDPQTSIFGPESIPRWSLEVCRGCIYNCAICGGSAYSYKTYLGREKPGFRSPRKIIQDIRKLNGQGIKIIGLYQDPRMGGERYWQGLLAALRTETLDIERLSIDLLVPCDEEFIKAVAAIERPVTLHICPDSGCDSVRRRLGRQYTNEDLLRTVKLCHKYFIPVTSFFSVGLAGETAENVQETWELSQKLSELEQIALIQGSSWGMRSNIPLGGPITGPIVLDPGSPAFDFPEKYGYKLFYKSLEEYIEALSQPSWHQWLNYETELLNKKAIINLILQSIDFSIDERREYGFSTPYQADIEHRKLKGDIIALNEVDRILKLESAEEREAALRSLRNKLDEFLNRPLIDK